MVAVVLTVKHSGVLEPFDGERSLQSGRRLHKWVNVKLLDGVAIA